MPRPMATAPPASQITRILPLRGGYAPRQVQRRIGGANRNDDGKQNETVIVRAGDYGIGG